MIAVSAETNKEIVTVPVPSDLAYGELGMVVAVQRIPYGVRSAWGDVSYKLVGEYTQAGVRYFQLEVTKRMR